MELPQTDAKQLMADVALLVEHLKRTGDGVAQQVAHGVSDLARAAQEVGAGGQHLAREALEVVRGEARAAVEAGVGEAVKRCETQLQESANAANWSAREVKEAALELRKQRGLWLWAAPLALVAGALMLAGGSGYLAWKNMRELKRAEFGQDILHATRTGVLTRCGEALCARVGKQPRRYGRDGEYVLLQK